MDIIQAFSDAIKSISIVTLAKSHGIQLREGTDQDNPFNPDHPAGTFSVYESYFKDRVDHKCAGGYIKFVQIVHPEWTNRMCAEHIIAVAGGYSEADENPLYADSMEDV